VNSGQGRVLRLFRTAVDEYTHKMVFHDDKN
jgi:hypothetical protein